MLINGYGPTESTTFACCYRMDKSYRPGTTIPIGLPIAHTTVQVLDEQLQPVPAGTPGELFIGGDGLAHGYLNNPELTGEKFIPDPRNPDALLFRTGDRVRAGAGGNLEFLGRFDNQLKIMGYRIEPGEIEAVLQEHSNVRQAVVISRTLKRGDKQLVAYVRPAGPGVFSSTELKRLLWPGLALPQHMIPARIVQVEEFPLNNNGKVDSSALPAHNLPESPESIAGPPATEMEGQLAALWSRILSCPVGLDENFFDAGGTSLQLLEVQLEVARILSRRISQTEFFEHPTVRSLQRDGLSGSENVKGAFDQAQDRARRQKESFARVKLTKGFQVMSDAGANHSSNAIAVIGLSGRWPRARNVAEFWRNIREGVDCISHFSTAELEVADAAALAAQPDYVKARSVLEGIDQFDAAFFGILPKEAELMDPQQRVFLEYCWEALEDGGYDPQTYAGAIGVYAGCSTNTYFLRNVCAGRDFVEDYAGSYPLGNYPTMLGAIADTLATRVSYKLNLRGPSLTLQTACSTSLVAVCHACQSLLNYQSDMVLAGGVSITVPQKRGYLYQEGGMGSADGRCRPFDANAQGTVFGCGAGVVLLKRLEDALADGDPIYAVIKGFAVNNDGSEKVGYTAPGVEGQANVIAMAHAAADVDPASITYLEAHGTATPLGDPIEFTALTRAFRARTEAKGFCALGTAKAIVGHLEAAAGVTGLINAIGALVHKQLPPAVGCETPNPEPRFLPTARSTSMHSLLPGSKLPVRAAPA